MTGPHQRQCFLNASHSGYGLTGCAAGGHRALRPLNSYKSSWTAAVRAA